MSKERPLVSMLEIACVVALALVSVAYVAMWSPVFYLLCAAASIVVVLLWRVRRGTMRPLALLLSIMLCVAAAAVYEFVRLPFGVFGLLALIGCAAGLIAGVLLVRAAVEAGFAGAFGLRCTQQRPILGVALPAVSFAFVLLALSNLVVGQNADVYVMGYTLLFALASMAVGVVLMRRQSVEDVSETFAAIYRRNAWRSAASVSGTGSDVIQTAVIRQQLPKLFASFEVRSILDIPCGDFAWMHQVPLESISYVGADIVDELVKENSERYSSAQVRFCRLDLLTDSLPQVDLILCRDCMVHFSNQHVLQALRAIVASGSTYLLATTFPVSGTANDIVTGLWRPIDLQAAPFNLRQPLLVMNEGNREDDGRYSDKSLALWRIADIATGIRTNEQT